MLTIRDQQFDAFLAAAAVRLADDLAVGLAVRHPDRTRGLSPKGVAEVVRLSIDSGRSGMGSIAESIWPPSPSCPLAIGPRFHEHPRIHEILADEGIAPEDRIDIALDEVPLEEWELGLLDRRRAGGREENSYASPAPEAGRMPGGWGGAHGQRRCRRAGRAATADPEP